MALASIVAMLGFLEVEFNVQLSIREYRGREKIASCSKS